MQGTVRIWIGAAAVALLSLAGGAFLWLGGNDDSSRSAEAMICATDSTSRTSPLYRNPLPDAAVKAIDGSPAMLHDLAGPRFTVFVFASVTCPCSDGYTDRLRELRERYEPRGVRFLALNANADEDVERIKGYLVRKKYPLPMYRDELRVVADTLGATVTPEIFVFGADWLLAYHGRIDDDKSGLFVEEASLALALDTLLTGRALRAAEKPARGCAIRR